MITLDFADALVENAFSYGNHYSYSERRSYGMYFSNESQNYPFILKGGGSDDFELEYCLYSYQLRGRLLNTKKIKEVMNSARIPMYFMIKHVPYLIGKGFLSTYDINGSHQLLFLACVDGTKNITSIKQVKFYVSKMVYEDRYKAVQLAVKDLVAGHSGDVIMCNSILDYVGEKITLPRGGSLPELMKYKQVVVRTCLSEVFSTRNTSTDPLVVESNHGTVAIHTGDSVDAAIMDTSMDTSDIIRALRELTPLESNDEIIPTFTASVASADIPDAISRGLIGHAIRYTF